MTGEYFVDGGIREPAPDDGRYDIWLDALTLYRMGKIDERTYIIMSYQEGLLTRGERDDRLRRLK